MFGWVYLKLLIDKKNFIPKIMALKIFLKFKPSMISHKHKREHDFNDATGVKSQPKTLLKIKHKF